MRIRGKFSRTPKQRLEMIKVLLTALITHERIETTLAKAKELRRHADRMVTYGKRGTLESWQKAARYVHAEECMYKLFTQFAIRYRYRYGGYTRVLRSRIRNGDCAQMAFIEYVDRPGELRPARVPPIPPEFLSKAAALMQQQSLQQQQEDQEQNLIGKD
eukprot:TRINITY_DN2165_c0_g1_i1.p2 TRINITY_DN2165_c0_g1~~TRINITY_DN2165_c0_g1_i1.p2  ORF type:complete len:160 (-),score=8.82 TRINITY_DN2165_c0_g1_i1:243-722(-)